jgi:RNA polymerase sigma-70 factor (ECF subfamily)
MTKQFPEGDTALGGARRDFPSTCWSRFQDDSAADPGHRARAGEALAQRYWKPIYAYIRAKWSKSVEDAKDLTQDFFLWMMETDFLSKADPDRGRFRTFVKVALEHYVQKEKRDRQALKRGGARPLLSFDQAGEELAALGAPDPGLLSADEALDRTWRNELMADAAKRLESSLVSEGKETYFFVFRDHHLSESDPSYRLLAERYGLTEVDVTNYLRETKRRYRAVLADVVAETVTTDRDLREELEALFGDGAL